MDKKKTSRQLLEELKTLLDVRKNLIGVEQINGIIADKADEFVETLCTEIDDEVDKMFESSRPPKKSELPCNCLEKSKTLQEVIDEAKAELTDGKTFAAIVFRVD